MMMNLSKKRKLSMKERNNGHISHDLWSKLNKWKRLAENREKKGEKREKNGGKQRFKNGLKVATLKIKSNQSRLEPSWSVTLKKKFERK